MENGMRDKLLQKLVDFFSGMGDDESGENDQNEGMLGHEEGESLGEESAEQPEAGLDIMIGAPAKGAPSMADDLKNKLMKG